MVGGISFWKKRCERLAKLNVRHQFIEQSPHADTVNDSRLLTLFVTNSVTNLRIAVVTGGSPTYVFIPVKIGVMVGLSIQNYELRLSLNIRRLTANS